MKIVSKEIAIKLRDLSFSCGSHYIYLKASNESIHISEEENMAQYMSDNEASDHSLSNYEIQEFTGSYENVECEAPYLSDVEEWLEQQGYHVGVCPYFDNESEQENIEWKFSVVTDNDIIQSNFEETRFWEIDGSGYDTKEEAWENALDMCLVNMEYANNIKDYGDEF
jgi:hypothetical protein